MRNPRLAAGDFSGLVFLAEPREHLVERAKELVDRCHREHLGIIISCLAISLRPRSIHYRHNPGLGEPARIGGGPHRGSYPSPASAMARAFSTSSTASGWNFLYSSINITSFNDTFIVPPPHWLLSTSLVGRCGAVLWWAMMRFFKHKKSPGQGAPEGQKLSFS